MPQGQRQPQRPAKSSSQTPKNWPQGLTHLTTLKIPPPLSSASLELQSPPAAITGTAASVGSQCESSAKSASSLPVIESKAIVSPNPLVRIIPITLPTHPAHGQYGLFATRALPPSSFVILYLGTLHSTSDPNYATSDYDLSLDRDLGLAVDASQCGNEARFINDYRGIRRAGPNAEFRDCLVQVGPGFGRLERRIGVFVLSPGKAGGSRAKGIAKGEEIVVSYGKGFWNARKDG